MDAASEARHEVRILTFRSIPPRSEARSSKLDARVVGGSQLKAVMRWSVRLTSMDSALEARIAVFHVVVTYRWETVVADHLVAAVGVADRLTLVSQGVVCQAIAALSHSSSHPYSTGRYTHVFNEGYTRGC